MRIEDFVDRPPDLAGLAEEGAGGLGLTAAAQRPSPLDEPWLLPIEHFSASSLHMLEVCPRQWQQRYLLGRKEPPGQSLVLGSVTHGGIEFGLTQKLLTQEDPDLGLTVTFYHDNVWPGVLDRYGGEGEVIWDDKPDTVRAKGAELVSAYHPRISILEPEAVEYEFLLDLGMPVPLNGFIDLVQGDGRPSIDFKTSAKRVSEPKPQWMMQGRIYQLAVPRPLDFHVITSKGTPQIVTGLEADEMIIPYSELLAVQTKRRVAEALAEANHFYNLYGPDDDWPMRGIHHDWRCSPKWCAFRKDCPVWMT